MFHVKNKIIQLRVPIRLNGSIEDDLNISINGHKDQFPQILVLTAVINLFPKSSNIMKLRIMNH